MRKKESQLECGEIVPANISALSEFEDSLESKSPFRRLEDNLNAGDAV
jgi:hypothetical protein